MYRAKSEAAPSVIPQDSPPCSNSWSSTTAWRLWRPLIEIVADGRPSVRVFVAGFRGSQGPSASDADDEKRPHEPDRRRIVVPHPAPRRVDRDRRDAGRWRRR